MHVGLWLVICGVRSFDWAYRIRRGKQLIGRARECDIRLEHRSVSRRHAEIAFDGEALEIGDLRSANGTYLNGIPIARARCEIGDIIRIGEVTLEILAVLETIRPACDDDEMTDQSPDDVPDSIEAAAELLSPTDGKVLKLMLEGLPEKAIAQRLKHSEETAHWRIKRIYKSLGVHSRSELFAVLLRPKR